LKGLFPPDKEDLRIVDLKVSKVVIGNVVNANTGLYDQLNFHFDYPNYSRIQKNGMIYNFNNYNLQTEHPISWETDYDLYNNIYQDATPSTAAQSLLSNLFDGSKGSGKTELYARPAAWADISLSMQHETDGSSKVQLDSVSLSVTYDFQYKPVNIVNVQLNTNNKWFAPQFQLSLADKFQRRNGNGNVFRTYTKSAATKVSVTAPLKYGRYSFVNWATQNETPLANTAETDVSGGNTLKFTAGKDWSFKAMYHFDGAILNLPDTIYIGDSLHYILPIKNLGSGVLTWVVDSSSEWIRPANNSVTTSAAAELFFGVNPDTLNSRVGLLDISSTETESLHNYVYVVQNKGFAVPTYTFVGNGKWSDATNWKNGIKPPATLKAGDRIVIAPSNNGQCILDVKQVIPAAASLIIQKDADFRISGNLDIMGTRVLRVNTQAILKVENKK